MKLRNDEELVYTPTGVFKRPKINMQSYIDISDDLINKIQEILNGLALKKNLGTLTNEELIKGTTECDSYFNALNDNLTLAIEELNHFFDLTPVNLEED